MMNKKLFAILAVFSIANFSACANVNNLKPLSDNEIISKVSENLPEITNEFFPEEIFIKDAENIFKLSEKQIGEFKDYTKNNDRAFRQKVPSHVLVYQYMQNLGESFTYVEQTNAAETTLRTASGNCMSLAILTTALARIANIDIKYQLVNRFPIYQEYGSVIFNAQHVRSVIFESWGEIDSQVKMKREKVIIDYYPSNYSYASGYISEDEFISMYYNNLAAESLGKNDLPKSFWLSKKALSINSENSDVINTMAVLQKRIGNFELAEELYKYGIKVAPNKVSILKNYLIMLKAQNRIEDADRVSIELESLVDMNPFDWLRAANEAYDESDYLTAIKLHKKALKLAPYLHQGYFGIAKSEYMLGNYNSANRALKKAKEEAFHLKAKSLYESKLAALDKVRFN